MANEGWGDIRPSESISHYYKNGRSLCGKVGLYKAGLEADTEPSPDDCPRCRTRLDNIGAATPPADAAIYEPKPAKAAKPRKPKAATK